MLELTDYRKILNKVEKVLNERDLHFFYKTKKLYSLLNSNKAFDREFKRELYFTAVGARNSMRGINHRGLYVAAVLSEVANIIIFPKLAKYYGIRALTLLKMIETDSLEDLFSTFDCLEEKECINYLEA